MWVPGLQHRQEQLEAIELLGAEAIGDRLDRRHLGEQLQIRLIVAEKEQILPAPDLLGLDREVVVRHPHAPRIEDRDLGRDRLPPGLERHDHLGQPPALLAGPKRPRRQPRRMHPRRPLAQILSPVLSQARHLRNKARQGAARDACDRREPVLGGRRRAHLGNDSIDLRDSRLHAYHPTLLCCSPLAITFKVSEARRGY
jgi:hypothetical protein